MVLSFVLNNGFRINDQYWVKDLGGAAQAAIGSSTILLIMNFAVAFLSIGGSMPLIARATGAGNREERDTVIRHTFLLTGVISVLLGVLGWSFADELTGLFEVDSDVAPLMTTYMSAIYLGILPLMFAPLLDNLFIGMGNSKLPMIMQVLAVGLNLVLNPVLIYGSWAPEWVGIGSGFGIAGAAVATCISRGVAGLFGIVMLRKLYGVRFGLSGSPQVARMLQILRLGFPVALSIAIYAGVYGVLFALVLGPLGKDVGAGFSIGFNAFESVSYPFALGVAMAGASLVGRNLGAGSEQGAWQTVRHVRFMGRAVGLSFALIFYYGGPHIVPLFTDDSGVTLEALRYVGILAWSQVLVSEEVIHEKILFGAGHPRAIVWISTLGNLLRIPLGWFLAVDLGYGAAGLWWTINVTSLIKAVLLNLAVRRGNWVRPIGGSLSAGA